MGHSRLFLCFLGASCFTDGLWPVLLHESGGRQRPVVAQSSNAGDCHVELLTLSFFDVRSWQRDIISHFFLFFPRCDGEVFVFFCLYCHTKHTILIDWQHLLLPVTLSHQTASTQIRNGLRGWQENLWLNQTVWSANSYQSDYQELVLLCFNHLID